jgi:plastocyanin
MARYKGFGVLLLLVAAMLSAFALTGCGSKTAATDTTQADSTKAPASADASASKPADKSSGSAYVKINDGGFAPVTVTVKLGTKVFWTNHGKQIHNVTLDSGGSSGDIQPKAIAAHVFKEAGTFTYHDSLHPSLKGSIEVK